MKSKSISIQLTKASDLRVLFEKGKLKQSLIRSGATDEQADEVVNEIIKMLVVGMANGKDDN